MGTKQWRVLAVVTAFFAVGVGWGIWQQRLTQAQLAKATPLRLLCSNKWASDTVLKNFAMKHKVPIEHLTYQSASEMVRQLANMDGKVDVLCVSSFLLKSLVQSHWIKKSDFTGLTNYNDISVDFRSLPYDPRGEYGVPLLWNVYGVLGGVAKPDLSLEALSKSHRVAIWGEMVNIINVMQVGGFETHLAEHLQAPDEARFTQDMNSFKAHFSTFIKPDMQPSDYLARSDYAQVPLAQVSALLAKDGFSYFLPQSGAPLEVGLLSIGDKSAQPELAKLLIDELISTDHAVSLQERVAVGAVHKTLENLDSLPLSRRPQALRNFPLNRFRFPDVDTEALPRLSTAFRDKN